MKAIKPEILSKLPAPLSNAYWALMNEDQTQYFRRIHRLIDLIEVFCKMYTVGSICTFLDALFKKLEQEDIELNEKDILKIKVQLAAGLERPSLGIWWGFARDISDILKTLKIPHVLPGAENELVNKKSQIKIAFNEDLITFRNKYAHGATPSEADCKKELEQYQPKVFDLISKAISMQQVRLVICDDDLNFFEANGENLIPTAALTKGRVGHSWLISENKQTDLYPILNFKKVKDKVDFYFYNDLRDKHANYLNYPKADHLKDQKKELLSLIPISDWKNLGKEVDLEPFRQQIEMLTEVFKGRKEELKHIANFIAGENQRFLCIWGAPGVGKSALLARTTQILRCEPEMRITLDDGIEWPETKIYLVDFFIRRGATQTASVFFDSVNQRLDFMFKMRLEFGKSEDEKRKFFEERLYLISKKLKDTELLLLIVDGLDEISQGDPLLSHLPRLLPERIKVIFGARPQQDLRFSFYDQLDRERRTQFDLGGLRIEDISAVLMEHVNKYEIHAQYVEEVLRVSEGNPLYLKLLCNGLEEKIYQLNQSAALPKGMEDLYRNALHNLENRTPGTTKFLVYLAAAMDFVSPELAAEWLSIETPELRARYLDASLEFLYENPLTKELEDYQLFHESLREYLKKYYPTDCSNAQERICDWSAAWKKPNGDPAYKGDLLEYSMRYATKHLFQSYLSQQTAEMENRLAAIFENKTNESQKSIKLKLNHSAQNRRTELFQLTEDEEWRKLNFETCGNGEALGKSYYYLQRILVREDSTGAEFQKFISHAVDRYAEPERMYRIQKDLLRKPVKREKLSLHFERIASLSKMGENVEEKVLLSLLPLWSNEPQENIIPVELDKKVKDWLENSRSTAVKKLWNITRNKRWS